VGSVGVVVGEPGRCLSPFRGRFLHALSQLSDNVGKVAGTHIAPSAGVRQPGTRRSDEATLDQLHRVEGGEQVLGAVDTLQAAHRSQARFHIAVVSFTAVGRDYPVLEAGRRVLGVGRPGADGARVKRRLVGDDVLGGTTGRFNGSSEESLGCRQVACDRQPTVKHLAIEVNTPIQVVPFAQDLHLGLVHQPRRYWPCAMLADDIGQRRSELLDPAQDRSAAHVDASIGQDAGDAFGGGAQLQVVANSKQDDVTWEAMT